MEEINTSTVGVADKIGDINDEDNKKVAVFFDSRAKGPCVNLGNYIVAKMKEKNLPIILCYYLP